MQTTSCMACTSPHAFLASHTLRLQTDKAWQKNEFMRPLLALSRYFVLDFDSLAEDLVVELRNRHIALGLHDQYNHH
jgi:hypothetical protein